MFILRVKIRMFGFLILEGFFFVKRLCEKVLGSNCPNFPSKAIWKSKASTKACFLAWVASKGKVPMKGILKKRNCNLASRCAMYLKEEVSVDHLMYLEEKESVDHLFVHCHWVSLLWFLALFLMGVSWPQPFNGKDMLVAWRRRLKCWVYGIWKLAPLAIWCCT